MSMLGVLRATEQARTATGRAGACPRARAPEWAAALLALALSLAMPLLSGCGPQGGADSRDTAASATGVQDRALQESMGPIVDRSKEHLGPADKAIIQARRLLLQAIKTTQEGGVPPGVEPTYYELRAGEAVIARQADWRDVLTPEGFTLASV